ncbi:MAG TPA: hypothetical protein VGX48_17060 [Pyrinomonadaceae bacterium]|nr:hypothetical protein [Pyrinomonadaceae bacterium]
MKTQESRQHWLATYAVLVGLTPLIPVPFVDDVAKSYFRRRLVRQLASSNGRALSAEELDALSKEEDGGCARGCLTAVLVYPLKKIFRKVFFFLEWKRAADLTSQTYHFGYLIDHALRRGADGRTLLDVRPAADVGAAVAAVVREAPIKPVEGAVSATFSQSRKILRGGADLLGSSLRRLTRRAPPEQVAEAIKEVEPQEQRELQPVVTRLQRSIAAVPEEHFARLRSQLLARLGLPPG